jgi:hypothetical protein
MARLVRLMKARFFIAAMVLVIPGCGPTQWDRANSMSPGELSQLTDLQVCIAASHLAYFGTPISPTFLSEYRRRGVICDDSGFFIKVAGYTQERLDSDDDKKCQSYGAKPKTRAYLDCRIQLNAQHGRDAVSAQLIQEQHDATRAAAYHDLTTSGLELMKDSQPATSGSKLITETKCRSTPTGLDCTTW